MSATEPNERARGNLRKNPPNRAVESLAAPLVLIIAAFALTALPAAATTDPLGDRVAVVIGNGNYSASPLRNPGNDARRMAEVLRALGFDVVELVDADRARMKVAVEDLRRRAGRTGVALFYFAGHGVHVGAESYLLPVDIDTASAAEVAAKALRLGDILTRLGAAGERTNLVILDACRDNAFGHGDGRTASGLAAIDAPPGTLIAYATAPGKVAADGPGKLGLYTGALIDEIQRPGAQIEDVFKQARRRVIEASGGTQVPWESSSLIRDLYLLPTSAAASAVPADETVQLAAESRSRGANAEPAAADDRVTLGVMSFRSLGSTEHGFQREALRDALNTQLSQLSKVKVYSKEFLDFLVTRKGLTEIEAASQLGVTKLLSGSLVTVGDTLQIETHVVDVKTGLLELSCDVSGPVDDFLRLQDEMVFEVVSKLDLPLSADDERLLAARRATDPALLQLLLQAEGSVPQSAPDLRPTPTEQPSSTLDGWTRMLAANAAPLLRGLPFAPAAALAQVDDEAAIRALLEAYRLATEAEDVDKVAALYDRFPAATGDALRRYFDNIEDLQQRLEDIDIAVVGDEAVVSYTRADEFTDSRTGRPMSVSVRLTKTLVKRDGAWRLTTGQ